MNIDRIEYSINDSLYAPQSLTIGGSGAVRYESHSNRHSPTYAEIGTYEFVLPPAEMQSTRDALANPPVEGLPDHEGHLLSEDEIQRLVVVAGRRKIEKVAGTADPVDPRLRALLDRLDRISLQSLGHPVQTLTLDVTRVDLDAEGLLVADIRFKNRGRLPASGRDPADLVGDRAGGLYIRLIPDVPRELLNYSDIQQINVSKVEALGGGPEVTESRLTFTLPPNGTALFRVHARLKPSKHKGFEVTVVYENFEANLGNRTVLVGEIWSAATTVKAREAQIMR